jgi:hypothetical protein
MKRSTYLLTILMLALAFSCKNAQPSAEAKTQEAKTNYFPVIDFMKGEISYVDSTPLAILRYDISDRQLDSAYIKPAAFNQLASEFLLPELDSPYFGQHFSESSFFDQSTKSITFTYATKDSTAGLQRIDVLASPRPDGSNKVKSIYMEKTFVQKDTFILKKLFWKSQKNFLVITITRPGSKPAITQQLKVVWDNSDQF